MKRRILTALLATLLAGAGAVMIVNYVAGADRRAMAGVRTEEVVTVKSAVPAGTSAADLAAHVAVESLPASAIADGAVTDLSQVAGEVTTVDLVPGEQLLSSRMADPAALLPPNEVAVPPGLQQISVQLEPQRVLAGQLKAGATVGVFVSVQDKASQDTFTHLAIHRVLVTRVDGGLAATDSESDAKSGHDLMITLATTPGDAEKIVYAAETGHLWLSAEPSDAEGPTKIVTGGNVFK